MCLSPKEDCSFENAISFLTESGISEDAAEPLLVTLYLTLRRGVDSDSFETTKICLKQSGVKTEKIDSVLEYLYPFFNLTPANVC